jgi:hypothetical protein
MISEMEQIKVEQYLQKVKQRELLAKEKRKEKDRICHLKDKQNGKNKIESEESKARKKEIVECVCGAKVTRGQRCTSNSRGKSIKVLSPLEESNQRIKEDISSWFSQFIG